MYENRAAIILNLDWGVNSGKAFRSRLKAADGGAACGRSHELFLIIWAFRFMG